MIEPTVPFVDKTTGEWILSEYDVHCVSIGTGILGSGGGGPPKIGLLRTLTTLRKGGKIRVVHPNRCEKLYSQFFLLSDLDNNCY